MKDAIFKRDIKILYERIPPIFSSDFTNNFQNKKNACHPAIYQNNSKNPPQKLFLSFVNVKKEYPQID